MSSGYQMTGAVGGTGIGHVEVGTDGGKVVLKPWKGDVTLDAAKQEEFAQLYVAACHQAKVNAAQAASS